MDPIRVASVQFEHAPGDKAANFAKIEHFAGKAATAGVKILAFPECCITGYWFLRNLTREQLVATAEPAPDGPSARRLVELCRKHDMVIGAGLVEIDADGAMYNTYIVGLPDGRLEKHRKIQAFEHEAIRPGSRYTVFDTPYGWKLGVLICYDNNIIENVRVTALMGADILLAPHQTGGCNSVSPHGMKRIERKLWDQRHSDPAALHAELIGPKGKGWIMRWLPSRAHDNGMFIIFSNGIGVDDDEVRTGNAMILDPYGRTIVDTDAAKDDMVIADLDPELLTNCTGRRWMRVRRPELYSPLLQPTGRETDTRSVRFGVVSAK